MALSYSMKDLRKGLKVEIANIPYKIIEYQHVKPGKGGAFVRVKLRSYINKRVIDKTFHAGDRCKQPDLQTKDVQYLYKEAGIFSFMDNSTYEQIEVDKSQIGSSSIWFIEGMSVTLLFYNGKVIDVDIPLSVELKVVETSPNYKGDTQGGKKTAKLETGVSVQVPFHVLNGDIVKIDTLNGEYVEKVKK